MYCTTNLMLRGSLVRILFLLYILRGTRIHPTVASLRLEVIGDSRGAQKNNIVSFVSQVSGRFSSCKNIVRPNNDLNPYINSYVTDA